MESKELIVSTTNFEQVQEYYKQGYKLIQAVSHSYYDIEFDQNYIVTEYILELRNKHV